MATTKKTTDVTANLQADINLLKQDLHDMATILKQNGTIKAENMKDAAVVQLDQLKQSSQEQIQSAEQHIKANPLQAVGIAFAVGLLGSALLRK